MPESSRRLLLRVGVKLLFLFAIGTVLYTLFSSTVQTKQHDDRQLLQPIQLELHQIPTNSPHRLIWAGGNLIVIRRNAELIESLHQYEDQLEDPSSQFSNQPPGLASQARSLAPEIFIAFDHGTDMGCPLNWIPVGNREAPLQPWPGGFRDNCRGSWYDASGRVFHHQEAKRNLDIPEYRFIGENLMEIGRSGDNAAPAN